MNNYFVICITKGVIPLGFGTKFKKVLDERGMTVTVFAKRSGINRDTLYSIIRRDVEKPNLDLLIAIYEVLGIDPEQLLDIPQVEKQKKKNPPQVSVTEDPRYSILSELTPDELIRVTDFARGLIAARMERSE